MKSGDLKSSLNATAFGRLSAT